jgi:hypothetical protein
MKAKIQREIIACNKILNDKHMKNETGILKMLNNYKKVLEDILNKKVTEINLMDAAFVDDANKRLGATII